jgi:hypothetical protein
VIDYHPKTKLVPAKTLRIGDVFMERPAHPARVRKMTIIGQSTRESDWPLRPLPADALVAKAVR